MKKKLIALAVGAVAILGGLAAVPSVFERVDSGEYKIIQQMDGDMIVLSKPGWQYTGFVSQISDYNEGGVIYFSESKHDGGSSELSGPVSVRFNDGALGQINGNFQYRLPMDDETRVELHRLYGRNYEAVVHNLIRKSLYAAVIQSAVHFSGEEAYSYGRSDFINLISRQLKDGIYATIREQKVIKDAEGNEFMENFVEIRTDETGNPVIQEESKLDKFNVEIIGLVVEAVNLDSKTMTYIEKKKDAAFEKIQKQSEAEKAKQDAITAEELGKANVARAKYEAEVKKQSAVTKAEEKKAVAELKAKQELNVAKMARERAQEEAKATLVKKQAEAKAAKLLVQAGLTPREKAQFEKETRIGVARELAKAKVPKILINGGDGTNGTDPMSAVGMNMLLDIEKKLK